MNDETSPAELLERLRTHGWCKGTYGTGSGPNCILGAWKAVEAEKQGIYQNRVRGAFVNPCVKIINSVLDEQYGHADIPFFNDSLDTTFEDVETVLEKAQVRWNESI